MVPPVERHEVRVCHGTILLGAGGRWPPPRSRIPPAIRAPPSTCSAVIGSERSTSAKTAATNGCRLATSVAREAPIRWSDAEPEHVRQHERPERREQRAASQTFQPSVELLLGRLRQPDEQDQRPRRAPSTTALIRDGRVALHQRRDGDRVGGPGRRGREPEQDPAPVAGDVRRRCRAPRGRRRRTRSRRRSRSAATAARARARARSAPRRPASRRGSARSSTRSSARARRRTRAGSGRGRAPRAPTSGRSARRDPERPLGDERRSRGRSRPPAP